MIVYAHEFRQHIGIRSSAYKYYLPLQHRLGGEIVGVDGRDDHARLAKAIRRLRPSVVLVRGDLSNLYRTPLQMGIPYVVCENDVSSWRQGTTGREKEMLENAAGVVFTSDHHRKHLKLDGVKLPRHMTVWLRPSREALSFDPLPKLEGKHLVYAGGLLPWKRRTSAYGYRAYHRVFKSFVKAGWTVHLYPVKPMPNVMREYEQVGCVAHTPVPASNLYRELSQYTAGLHGYSWHDLPKRSLDYALHCMPNKTWEYLASGIPTITCNGGVSGKVIVDGGWGVEVDRRLAGIERLVLPEITDTMRYSQTSDADMDRFAQFITDV